MPDIVIPLPDGNAESVQARQMKRPHLYRVLSIPVFADNVRFDDVVECDDTDPERAPRFLAVVEPAQESITLQIVFAKRTKKSRNPVLDDLRAHEVQVENVASDLYVVSVPTARLEAVEALLDDYPQAVLRWWQDKPVTPSP